MAGFWDIADEDDKLEVSEAEAEALESAGLIRFDRGAGAYQPLRTWLAIEDEIYWLSGRSVTAQPR